MCKYRARHLLSGLSAHKHLYIMTLCFYGHFASSAKISSEHPLLCQPDRPGSAISAKDAARPTEQASETSYTRKGLASEFYIHPGRIYSLLGKRMQEQGKIVQDNFNSPRRQKNTKNLLTSRLTCAKLNLTDAERASFDASVWRALCETRKNLN